MIGARAKNTSWTRRVPVVVAALLALLGHLAQAVHFAAHAHVYCPVHQRVEHAGLAHGEPGAHGGCCGHGHGDGLGDGHGDEGHDPDCGEGEHEACGMQPPGKLADVPAPLLGALAGPSAPAQTAPVPAQERHGLDPLVMAPKHSPPAA